MAAALLAGAAAGVSGQRLPPPRIAAGPLALTALARDSALRPPTANLALGGVAGGIAGGFMGSLVGYYLTGGNHQCGDDSCGLLGGIVGFLVGEPLGVGAGVNLADSSRGNALLDVVGAAGVGYLGLAAVGPSKTWGVLPVAAVAQIALSVAIERASAR